MSPKSTSFDPKDLIYGGLLQVLRYLNDTDSISGIEECGYVPLLNASRRTSLEVGVVFTEYEVPAKLGR